MGIDIDNIPEKKHNKHTREYPVAYLWYGKHAYEPIEQVIQLYPDYFFWMLETFQNVTPGQAAHFKVCYGEVIPPEAIEDVEPYYYIKKDPPELYQELCKFPRPELKPTLDLFRNT